MSRIIDSHSHCIYPEYLDIVAKNGALMEDGFRHLRQPGSHAAEVSVNRC